MFPTLLKAAREYNCPVLSTSILYYDDMQHNLQEKNLGKTNMVSAVKKYGFETFAIAGGVASNSLLRQMIAPLSPVFAQPQYSTDNAMGVAVLTFLNQEG